MDFSAYVESREIAEAIVRDEIHSCINITAGHSQPAITYFTGKLTKPDVVLGQVKKLEEIREMQKRWFIELVRQADIDLCSNEVAGCSIRITKKSS